MVNESINYDSMWKELQEIIEKELPTPKLPHEKTVKELKKMWGVTDRDIDLAVQKLLSEGKLGTRTAKSGNGKNCTVYFPI